LRLAVHKLYFFCNDNWRWNTFDLCLVVFSLVLAVIAESGTNLKWLRNFRVLRLAKLLRALNAFRTVQLLSDLRLMITCVIGSCLTLLWCVVLILFIQYIFAMLFVQSFATFLVDSGPEIDAADADAIMEHFGSVYSAMRSLLMATTGGNDWSLYLHDIRVTGYASIEALFLFYIMFFMVATWNIITGTFVNQAFKLAQPDMETITLEKFRRDQADVQHFMDAFLAADTDKSGDVSIEEFHELLRGPFQDLLHVRGIAVKDAESFYKTLARSTDDGKVDAEAFVSGCLQMKGQASSIDLHALEFRLVRTMQKMLRPHTDESLEDATKELKQICARLRQAESQYMYLPPVQPHLLKGTPPPEHLTVIC